MSLSCRVGLITPRLLSAFRPPACELEIDLMDDLDGRLRSYNASRGERRLAGAAASADAQVCPLWKSYKKGNAQVECTNYSGIKTQETNLSFAFVISDDEMTELSALRLLCSALIWLHFLTTFYLDIICKLMHRNESKYIICQTLLAITKQRTGAACWCHI